MKKLLLTLLLSTFLLSGCGASNSDSSLPTGTNQTENMEQTENEAALDKSEEEQVGEDVSQNQTSENASAENASQSSLSDEIAAEISYAEEQEKEVEKKQEAATTQMDMNLTAKEMYQLWDDTLNAVWKLLEANLSEADMEVLRKEEKEWIAFKEAEAQEAGLENEGGSLQPLLEAVTAAELTKERVYELAEYAEGK